MLIGVSGESLCGLIVGLRDSFPPFVSLIYMVSRMRVRWWGVTSVDAYMVMGVSFVSGKSPAEPDQKELPQTATESMGMIVSDGVVRFFFDCVCLRFICDKYPWPSVCKGFSDSFPVYIASSCIYNCGELSCCRCVDGECLCWNEWVVRDGVVYGCCSDCVGQALE